jgi:hypothetical protein
MKTFSFWRFTRWALLNAGALACAYFGLITGEQWALNLLRFSTAVFSVLSLVAFSRDVRKAAQSVGRSVPAVVANAVDIAMITLCAATGHFWLAAGWVWSAIAEAILYSGDTKGGAS